MGLQHGDLLSTPWFVSRQDERPSERHGSVRDGRRYGARLRSGKRIFKRYTVSYVQVYLGCGSRLQYAAGDVRAGTRGTKCVDVTYFGHE